MILLLIAQFVSGFSELLSLSKTTGSTIGVITLVAGALLVVAMVMAVLKIKWGLVLGIIGGAWMLFQPILIGSLEAQLGQSITWWNLMVTMMPALLLIYFCVLAWKNVFPQELI